MSKAENGARWFVSGALNLVGKALGASTDLGVGGLKGGGDAVKAVKNSPRTKSTVEAGKKAGGYIKDKTVNLVNKVQVATTEPSKEEKEG